MRLRKGEGIYGYLICLSCLVVAASGIVAMLAFLDSLVRSHRYPGLGL